MKVEGFYVLLQTTGTEVEPEKDETPSETGTSLVPGRRQAGAGLAREPRRELPAQE